MSSAVSLSVVLALAVSSCAQAPKQLSETDRKSLGRVGIVSAQFQPEINLTLPAKGGGRGALRGAKEGVKDVIIAGAVTPIPGAIFLGILLSPIAAVGGAVYGAIAAPSGKVVARHEKVLGSIIRHLELNHAIREGIITYAAEKARYSTVELGNTGPARPGEEHNYLDVALHGIDTVLEVSASEVSTEGAAINSPFNWVIKADARLVRTADSTVLAAYHSHYTSHTHTLEEWGDHDGRLFKAALKEGVSQTSRKIVYELLIVYDAGPAESTRKTGESFSGRGPVVRPPTLILPKLHTSFFSGDWLEVNTLTPEFCWKASPNPDRQELRGIEKTNELTQPTYEVEIHQGDELVYQREGLKETCHHLTRPLERDREYRWSVKTWFELDGRVRATRPGAVLFKTPSGPDHLE